MAPTAPANCTTGTPATAGGGTDTGPRLAATAVSIRNTAAVINPMAAVTTLMNRTRNTPSHTITQSSSVQFFDESNKMMLAIASFFDAGNGDRGQRYAP